MQTFNGKASRWVDANQYHQNTNHEVSMMNFFGAIVIIGVVLGLFAPILF